MAAEPKREPGPLRRWLQKLRANWRRAGDMGDRAGAARRADVTNADRYGSPGSRDPGTGGGF
jgi:hypothetical protein